MKDLCETCGIGFYLHSGDDARCDHCDSVRKRNSPSPIANSQAKRAAYFPGVPSGALARVQPGLLEII